MAHGTESQGAVDRHRQRAGGTGDCGNELVSGGAEDLLNRWERVDVALDLQTEGSACAVDDLPVSRLG